MCHERAIMQSSGEASLICSPAGYWFGAECDIYFSWPCKTVAIRHAGPHKVMPSSFGPPFQLLNGSTHDINLIAILVKEKKAGEVRPTNFRQPGS